MSSARDKRVAVVPGDDAAPEAMHATLGILRALDVPVEWIVVPEEADESMVRETVDSCDSCLFGATSGKTPGILYLRWGKRTYANVRPIRWRPGFPSPLRRPEGIDYVIVRENLEDLYTGIQGSIEQLRASQLPLRTYASLVGGRDDVATSTDGRYAVKVITRENTQAVARFACELALGRRGKVTCATKRNILPVPDGFFADVVREVVSGYSGLTYEEFLVDDFARRLVASPHDLDVVVLQNLYGDLLSDEGAGTIGGLGVCPSGCYGDDFAYFEPVHGTAPDIAGKGIINPIATMLSAAMLLEHLGFADAAGRLDRAVEEAVVVRGNVTPDLGGSGTTDGFATAVRASLT